MLELRFRTTAHRIFQISYTTLKNNHAKLSTAIDYLFFRIQR
jgi:hypothetical protein